jgi:hypothetical protein
MVHKTHVSAGAVLAIVVLYKLDNMKSAISRKPGVLSPPLLKEDLGGL